MVPLRGGRCGVGYFTSTLVRRTGEWQTAVLRAAREQIFEPEVCVMHVPTNLLVLQWMNNFPGVWINRYSLYMGCMVRDIGYVPNLLFVIQGSK